MKYFNYLTMTALVITGSLCAEEKLGPGFAIKNDAKQPVWFTVINGQNEIGQLEQLNAGQEAVRTIPERSLSMFTYLIIWESKPENFKIETSRKVFGGETIDVILSKDTIFRAIKPSPNYIYTFTKGNTIYVTWDKNKKLVPQRASKYPLTRNVNGELDVVLLYKNIE